MWRAVVLIFSACVAASATAQPVFDAITHPYKEGGTELEGYLVFESSRTDKRPGILIIHDWNGIDDYEQGRARQLAAMGYVALAADIYGRGVRPKNAQESGAEAGKYRNNVELFRKRLTAGLEELKKHPLVDSTKVAAIGYCFGGTGVIELARTGAALKGVVSFHGGLTLAPEASKNIKAKMLVCHGDEDPSVPRERVQEFLKEMADANVDYQFIAYSDAVHSFTNPGAGNDPSRGNAYNAVADRRSWEHMKLFFDELFR